MKTVSFFSILFFLIYLSAANAQSGDDVILPSVEEQWGGLLPTVSLPGESGSHLFSSQQVHSAISVDTSLPMRQPSSSSRQSIEVGFIIFCNWLVDWFFPHKYREYRAGPPVQQVPLTTPPVIKQPFNSIQSGQKSSRKRKKVSGKTFANITEELIIRANDYGVTYDELTSNKIPSNFASPSVWGVICAIHQAFEKTQKSRLVLQSIDEVLSRHDPGLLLVAKPILQVIYSFEYEGIVSQHDRNMISFWMDYIIAAHESHLDWREWLLSSSEESDELLHAPNDYLMNVKIAAEDEQPPHVLYGFSRTELTPKTRPDGFSSIALWNISVELDRSIARNHPLYWEDDPVLTAAFSHILYFFAYIPSVLASSEYYLIRVYASNKNYCSE